MTHWTKITPETWEFTDSSYQKLHTPSEYLWTTKQKVAMEEKRMKKQKNHNPSAMTSFAPDKDEDYKNPKYGKLP